MTEVPAAVMKSDPPFPQLARDAVYLSEPWPPQVYMQAGRGRRVGGGPPRPGLLPAGGNSRTAMVAALSPADINYDETLSTLRCVLQGGGPRPPHPGNWTCLLVPGTTGPDAKAPPRGEDTTLSLLLLGTQFPRKGAGLGDAPCGSLASGPTDSKGHEPLPCVAAPGSPLLRPSPPRLCPGQGSGCPRACPARAQPTVPLAVQVRRPGQTDTL